MKQAKHGDAVKVHYTGKLEDGTVFDSSNDREPLQFTIGETEVLAIFQQAVIGMSPGESKTEKVPADQAYGSHQKDLVFKVDRKQIPSDLKPEVGQMLQIQRGDGQIIPVEVTDISESKVTLDANYPLAGKDLIFDIQLLEIV